MPFETTATSEVITIDGFSFAPAEAETLKNAVSFAGGMRNFPALPEAMPYLEFVVRFSEDGTLTISRSNFEEPGITFSFDTVDSLIVAIETGLSISVDRKRLDPAPRGTGGVPVTWGSSIDPT